MQARHKLHIWSKKAARIHTFSTASFLERANSRLLAAGASETPACLLAPAGAGAPTGQAGPRQSGGENGEHEDRELTQEDHGQAGPVAAGLEDPAVVAGDLRLEGLVVDGLLQAVRDLGGAEPAQDVGGHVALGAAGEEASRRAVVVLQAERVSHQEVPERKAKKISFVVYR